MYGKSTDVPFNEDADLVHGRRRPSTAGHMPAARRIDEFLALAYYKEQRLPVVVVRLFNTVGPRQTGRYGMVIPNFVRQALAGDPITVFGDGTQTPPFTYVEDVVDGLIALIQSRRRIGEVFNIGNTEEISVLDLAKRIKAMTGSPSKIVLVPYDEAYEEGFEDMPRRVPDLGKIDALIGFTPRRSLDAILHRVVEHMRVSVAR